ncbi:MAG TPA: DinB family protein [Pyrinomonadaceae bacterium]|jgi:uncharacterized damage-inducible protein DinB
MDVERRFLKPADGFSGELAFYLGNLEAARNRLRGLVTDLTDEELAARAFPEAHQIGNLILHLGESEAGWIWQIIAENELSEDDKKIVHWCDTTERDYAEKSYRAAECLERIDKISARSREILKNYTDADLDRFFGYERDGKRVEVTLRHVLTDLADHEAVHRGQISMLKRILRESR